MTNEELAALVKKNPISVGCGVLAVLLGVAIYFRSDSLPLATADLEQKSGEGRRLAANLQHSAQMNDHLAAVTTAGRQIDGRLVRVGELAKNLQYFYRLEAASGIKLIELRQNPQPRAPAGLRGPFTIVSYVVTAQGDYRALLDFLRRVENGTHFSRVTVASLGSTSLERSSPLKLTLMVELLGLP